VTGLLIGLPLAFLATRALKSVLYGVQPGDAITLGIAGVVILTVSLLATLLPMHQASHIDPMQALRYD
jgi:ABC-type lipoprotein release transport system permease subunit